MQKNNFTAEISKLSTVSQAMDRYKLSRLSIMKYADQFDALVRFGRSVRIDVEKFDAGIAANTSQK